jgi:hypothetical protein
VSNIVHVSKLALGQADDPLRGKSDVALIPSISSQVLVQVANPNELLSGGGDILLFGEKVFKKGMGEMLILEVENVFKIAITCSRVREFLTSRSWEFQGKDEEMEMDSFRNNKAGKKVFVEDISEDFPVTFLMGEISLPEFSIIARELTPKIQLLEVDSSWEGEPTTIVVAMTEEQVKNMFGKRTKMRKIAFPPRV